MTDQYERGVYVHSRLLQHWSSMGTSVCMHSRALTRESGKKNDYDIVNSLFFSCNHSLIVSSFFWSITYWIVLFTYSQFSTYYIELFVFIHRSNSMDKMLPLLFQCKSSECNDIFKSELVPIDERHNKKKMTRLLLRIHSTTLTCRSCLDNQFSFFVYRWRCLMFGRLNNEIHHHPTLDLINFHENIWKILLFSIHVRRIELDQKWNTRKSCQ